MRIGEARQYANGEDQQSEVLFHSSNRQVQAIGMAESFNQLSRERTRLQRSFCAQRHFSARGFAIHSTPRCRVGIGDAEVATARNRKRGLTDQHESLIIQLPPFRRQIASSMNNSQLKVFSGRANIALAEKIAQYLAIRSEDHLAEFPRRRILGAHR